VVAQLSRPIKSTSNVSTFTTLMTPELAAHWLATRQYKHQRRIRRWHVEDLADTIRRGEFYGATIVLGALDGALFILDGYHRLMAIAQAGMPVEVTIVTYAATSEDHLADIYGRIDRGMSRTFPEIFAAHELDSVTGLSLKQVQLVASCAPLVRNAFRRPGPNTVGRIGKSADRRMDFVL
jgi:hypothetical protein